MFMLTTLSYIYSVSFKCKQPLEAILKLNSCLADIRRWMITNKLKINDSKTEFIVFRSPRREHITPVLIKFTMAQNSR